MWAKKEPPKSISEFYELTKQIRAEVEAGTVFDENGKMFIPESFRDYKWMQMFNAAKAFNKEKMFELLMTNLLIAFTETEYLKRNGKPIPQAE